MRLMAGVGALIIAVGAGAAGFPGIFFPGKGRHPIVINPTIT